MFPQTRIDMNAKNENKLTEKEEELRQICANDSSSGLIEIIKDINKLGIDVNAKDRRGKNALHHLCGNNSTSNLIDAIQLLIKLGIDVNAEDDDGRNALYYLCQYNSTSNLIDAIQLLIKLGIDVNAKDENGWNALHLLCRYNATSNLIDAIQLLIQLGIDVNAKDDREQNALHHLCTKNSTSNLIDAIQLLIKLGIDVNAKDIRGWNALHHLRRNWSNPNLINGIRFLIQLGIDVNAKDEYGRNALHLLCQENSNPKLNVVIPLLIELGIDVIAKDECGRNALNYLADDNHRSRKWEYGERSKLDDAIRMLEMATFTASTNKLPCSTELKHGVYKDENTEFASVSSEDSREISSVLPGKSGVSIDDDNGVNTKDKGEKNAFHFLCQNNPTSNLINEVKRLIELGYNVHDRDKNGRNAFHYLCQNTSSYLVEAIKFFIDCGIDMNAKDIDEWNALHHLCRFNSSLDLGKAIRILVQHGIEANDKTNDGCNTLHLLCQNNSTTRNLLEIVSILIETGVDINEKTKRGESAIDFLVKNEMDDTLKSNVLGFLIRHGIQVHADNEASQNVNRYFFKENDNYGGRFLNFLAKNETRFGWHAGCENCHQILSIERSYRAGLLHHHMFSNCYRVFHFLVKHLEKWAKSIQKPGESELDMKNPTEWLRRKAEQYPQSGTAKSYKESFLVMAEVGDQIKDGSNSGEFNCGNYERYLRSMYAIAEMINSNESMGQIKWFYLLPFDFPIDYGNEKDADVKRAKIEWDRTLFSWAHKETDEYYGKFMKEDAHEGFFLPKEFKHKCHEIDGKPLKLYAEQLIEEMLETNANKRMTSTEMAKQMKSIEDKLFEKEEELRQLCATDSSPALVQKIRDTNSRGIDVNAMDKDGRNALHYLCQHNSSSTLIDAIKLLIQLGIRIISNGHDARSILRQHYKQTNIEEIIELLDSAALSGPNG